MLLGRTVGLSYKEYLLELRARDMEKGDKSPPHAYRLLPPRFKVN